MKLLVTGSAGHLGEALMRALPGLGHSPVGMDINPSEYTDVVGPVTDAARVREAMAGVEAVLHVATLHKPHVASHSKQDFIDTNVTGTLCLLEAAVELGVRRVVFTSTTSAFGAALIPAPGGPAAWIEESAAGLPKNIYGVTKLAAEDLCALFARKHGLNCTVLRTSRFFPEADDSKEVRDRFSQENAKANEFLFRRVDLLDVVHAHECALRDGVPSVSGGFARYIISATSPFQREHLGDLRRNPGAVVAALYPEFSKIYAAAGFHMFDDIARVYVNDHARQGLGWVPRYDFARILAQISAGQPIGSDLARAVGVKGYHDEVFDDGPYPVE